MKIAIINCKSKKQNYVCEAQKMYQPSFVFVAQQEFVSKAYDEYYIISTKYGIISPTTIIEPYDMTLSKGSSHYSTNLNSTTPDLKFLTKQVKEWLEQHKEDKIDCHITRDYWNIIKPYQTENIRHIIQKHNTAFNKLYYNEASKIFNNNLEECLEKLKEKPKPNPEKPHVWIHDELGEFNGTGYQLWKKYYKQYNLSQPSLRAVGQGKSKTHKGWKLKPQSNPFFKY
jgi:hypothetical protein